jgi:RND family efflux transporter MFP subunit
MNAAHDGSPKFGRALVLPAVLALLVAGCGPKKEASAPVSAAPAVQAFTVREAPVAELKSAFAVVDSPDAVSARTRISGRVTQLLIDEGVKVRRGALMAVVINESLGPQAAAPRAQAAALRDQLAQAEKDIARYKALHAQGFFPTQKLEEAQANADNLRNQVRALQAETSAVVSTAGQGRVLAPADGVVLKVQVTPGTAVMAGDPVALVGATFILRVKVPERHARFLREGGQVLVETPDGGRAEAKVLKVYPALRDGRVEADVSADGLPGALYGQRVRVWIPAGEDRALVVPSSYLQTRYGVDFAKVLRRGGGIEEVVVRRGEPASTAGVPDGVEVLSGLSAGDRIVR